jgi:ankyrin repeat protein
MTDQEQETDNTNHGSTRLGHRRNGSVPNSRASLSLSQLERGWSTGNHTLLPHESLSTTSTGLQDSFAEHWASGSFSTTSADFPRRASTTSLPIVPHSFHRSIGPISDMAAATPGRDAEQMLKSLSDENAVSSIIHDEARVVAWNTVLQLCKTHPHHAQYAGPDGWTALHHACNRRCDRVDVIEALLKAYPSALLDLSEKGMTPLHYACRFKAPRDTIRSLLYQFPALGKLAVSKRDARGRTPLWYAVRYDAPKGVVEMLLELDPTVVLEEDKTGESPLSLVWDTWAEKFEGKKTLAPFLQEDGVKSRNDMPHAFFSALEQNKKLKSRWETTNLFLRANFGMIDGHRHYRMLHATAAIACHPTLFRLASCLYPEQAAELDNCDLSASQQTALHLAAASCASGEHGKTVIKTLLQLYPDAVRIQDSKDGSLPLHKMVVHKSHWIHDGIRDVYLANKEAISAGDFQGRLPLHRAAAANQAGGGPGGSIILQLMEECPETAAIADASGRLALHYMAEFGETWEEEAEAVYRAHESAIRVRAGAEQRLPIHLAAASPDARRSMLETLVEMHPRGARQADRTGKLPLHLACESGKLWSKGIGAIYDAYPDAIRETCNNKGWVALQIAAASPNTPGDVISQLASLYPEAAERVDTDGRCALHWACETGKEWYSGLNEILHANPSANIHPDNTGKLPFHIVALRLSEVKENDENERDDEVEEERRTFETRARASLMDLNADITVDPEAAKVEILYQLLMADPIILPQV